ncbi:hypothetical protein ACSCB1_35425 [Streptomyces europaeiscabiei]|uniref:hypothetical protein n=1 Tax=Streptomyces europaeiscabiei TaxID=146819 RepID=UPI000628676C|nr:hypothetical protein [Streptomyces europaeiscabiei]
MVTYFTESNDPWDDTDTITGASGQLVELEVTYTGDGSQSYPMVTPYLDLFVNGTDEANRVPLDGTAYNDGSGNTAALRKMLLVDAAHLDDELVTKWFVEVLVNGTVTYYAKAYAAGTSRGTLTVVRTA